MRFVKMTLVLLLLLASAASAAADFHVAPDGSDEDPGTAEEPFRSLERARKVVRTLKDREGLPSGGITVWLHGGQYLRQGTFRLGRQDSGREGAPVVYRAAPGEHPRITGGPVVPASRVSPVKDPQMLARLPRECRERVRVVDLGELGLADVAGPWPDRFRGYAGWPELFCGDRPMALARWPNEGWAEIEKVIDRGDGKPGVFRYEGERPGRWKDADRVYLNGYWAKKWYDECIRAGEIDAENRTVTLAAPHHYGLDASHGAGLFYAMNLPEELDRPGEYVIDPEKDRIYFLPPEEAGGRPALSAVEAPLVEIENASHLRLRGLTFERVRGGGPVIRIRNGTDSLMSGCTVRNAAGWAVAVEGGNGCGVESCELYNLGKGGVNLSGGDRDTLQACGNSVTNSHVHHFGRLLRTYQPAVRLGGVGCRMSHNDVHYAPHAAVLFGGNEHVIEFNEIHHVCRDTDDAGAIYAGRDWTVRGTDIRYNFFHHLAGGTHVGNQGVYLDDMLCGTRVYGNVFYRMGRAIMIGGGRDNVVENNVAVDCRVSIHIDARGLGWAGYHVEGSDGTLPRRLRRVPYKEEPWRSRYPELVDILENRPGAPVGNVVRRNVFVRCDTRELASEARELSTIENNLSTDGDAGFVAPDELNFALQEDSPVFEKLPGFEPIPFDRIGPRR